MSKSHDISSAHLDGVNGNGIYTKGGDFSLDKVEVIDFTQDEEKRDIVHARIYLQGLPGGIDYVGKAAEWKKAAQERKWLIIYKPDAPDQMLHLIDPLKVTGICNPDPMKHKEFDASAAAVLFESGRIQPFDMARAALSPVIFNAQEKARQSKPARIASVASAWQNR